MSEKKENLVINPVFSPLFSDELDDKRYYNVFGGRGCFLAGQKVVMDDGKTKSIDKISKGDFVRSYNTKTNKVEVKKVTDTMKYSSKDYIRIKLKNGSEIKCTLDHKFLYKGEWIQIQEILKMKYGEKFQSILNTKRLITED